MDLTYKMLQQCLIEAKARVEPLNNWPDDVRARSAETVAMIQEKLAAEGITETQLAKLARQKAA